MTESLIHKNYLLQKNSQLISLILLPELNDVQWGEIETIGAEILNEIDEFQTPIMLVDLSALNYMGSAMVALIVRVWKAVKAKDGKMSVVCPDEMVKQVLALAHLNKVWPIHDTRELALKPLGVKDVEKVIIPNPPNPSSLSMVSALHARPLLPISSSLPMWLGIIGVIVGIVGLVLLLSVKAVPPKVAFGMAIGGSGIGFVLGMYSMIIDQDYKKNISILVVVAAIIVMIITLMNGM
jgi:anti-anti-sigma factor